MKKIAHRKQMPGSMSDIIELRTGRSDSITVASRLDLVLVVAQPENFFPRLFGFIDFHTRLPRGLRERKNFWNYDKNSSQTIVFQCLQLGTESSRQLRRAQQDRTRRNFLAGEASSRPKPWRRANATSLELRVT